jgi:VRR-NUC domain
MMTENQIQQQLTRLLESYCRPDVAWFAVPNGEWRFPKTAARLKASGVRPGAPDLVLVMDGKFYGVEVKSERGRPSEAQAAMGRLIERSGGSYIVCYGLISAIEYLSRIGVFAPGIKFTFHDNGEILRAI